MFDFGQPGAFRREGGAGGGQGGGMRVVNPDARVPITPPSFNQTTTLGRTCNIKFGATSDEMLNGIKESETVAFWQGNKVEAQAMSVDIGLVLPPSPTFVVGLLNPRDARGFALVEWGIDGYRQAQVAMDIGLGRRVAVIANYISVTVSMDEPGPGMQSATVAYGAGITAFSSHTQAPVIRTRYIDNIDQNAFSDLITVPLRAVQLLSPIVGDATTGAPVPPGFLNINWFGYDAQEIGQTLYDFTLNAPFNPQPVPPDAFAFRANYTGGGMAAQPSNIRLPFQLSM